MTTRRLRTLTTLLGWLGVALFVVIYAFELVPRHGPPMTIRWIERHFGLGGLIALNIAIVLAFLALLPYRRSTKGVWKSKGTFIAFVIALMTEMFGWPLLLFLLAPLVDVPQIARGFFDAVGHWPARVGTILSFAGIALVALGWHRIHRAVGRPTGRAAELASDRETGMVTDGIYRYMRHPQYTGLLLFTLGWILHWPSVVTLALWPILVGAYVWLARQEEKQALEDFGAAYAAYCKRTKRFLPGLV